MDCSRDSMNSEISGIPISEIGGVLTYESRGHGRPCGQTMGADGSGEFCVLILGTPEEARNKANELVRHLQEVKSYEALFVPNDSEEAYLGNPMEIGDVRERQTELTMRELLDENAVIEWSDPSPALNPDGSEATACVTHRATARDCAAIQRHTDAGRWVRRPTDEECLEEFIVINWATPESKG